jgi:hypothetical protein
MQYECLKWGEKNSVVNFPHPDDKIRWRKQRKMQGERWKYRNLKTNPIYFNTNSMGYRTHEFDFDNDNKYMLTLGCSNTYGLYLHEEERYSNLVESKTGIKTYNLGINGGSANIIMMNLIKFLHTAPKKPQAVIIQWPVHMRLCYPYNDTNLYRIRASTSYGKQNNIFEELVKQGNIIETHSKWAKDMSFDVLKTFNIKNISFCNNYDDKDFYDISYLKKVDSAYDNSHIGTQTNKNISEFILERL